MPDNKTIVEYLIKDSSTQTLKQIEEYHKRVYDQTDKNVAAFKRMQGAAEQQGRSLGTTMDALRGFGAGAYLAQSAVESLGNTSEKSASGIDTARSALQLLSLAIINPTPIGLMATAFGALVGALDAQERALQKALQPARDLQKGLGDLDNAHSSLGLSIQKVVGLTGEEADQWAKAAAGSDRVADSLRKQAREYEEVIRLQSLQTQIGPVTIYQSQLWGKTEEERNQILGRSADAARWAAMGMKFQQDETQKLVTTQNENKRVLDILTAAIPKVQQAWEDYRKTITELGKAHRKTMDDLKEQEVSAEADAAEQRTQIRLDTAKRLLQIEADLGRSFREMEYNRNLQLRADAHRRMLDERNDARELQGLTDDRNKQIFSLNRDYVKRWQTTKTYADYLALQQEYQDRLKDADDQRSEREKQLAEVKRDREEENAYQRGLQEEAYQHQRGLAIEAAEIQKTAVREAAQAQSEALEKALGKQLEAIQKRRDEESNAYADAQAKARTTRDEQIKALTDTRTEQEKLNAAIMALGPMINSNTQLLLAQYEVMKLLAQEGLTVASQTPGNYNPRYGGEYQFGGFLPAGGMGIVGEKGPEVIRSTSRGTQVTPINQGTRQPIIIYIGNERLNAHIDYRIELNDRGL